MSVGSGLGGISVGYPHPAAIGYSPAQEYYPSALYQTQTLGYPGYDVSGRDYYNNWVLNGTQDVCMSPESQHTPISTPSPTGMIRTPMGFEPAVTSWHTPSYQMTEAELAAAHNIPASELKHYESYTNAFGERCLRRRTTANRKERRRTLSINNAFSNLRCSIPNVPSDTKLSKIKTLRLAISYISYLNNILEKGESAVPEEDFKADISRKRSRGPAFMTSQPTVTKLPDSCDSDESTQSSTNSTSDAKVKGRTGWPQEVWASELGATSSPRSHDDTIIAGQVVP